MRRSRLYRFVATFAMAASALCSCVNNGEQSGMEDNKLITLGISAEVTTRVTVSDKENAQGKFDVKFDNGDKIGIYLYYNNFFDYYPEYNSYAESVIFANEQLTVNNDGASAKYSPIRSWTFSTLYGSKPYKYDAIAYYPYTSDYSIASKWSGGASNIFVYSYNPSMLERHCDFMIGSSSYTGTDSDGTNFRNEILGGKNNIALKFTRQMASLNLCVSKADHLKDDDIVVNSLEFYFESNNRFVFDQSQGKGKWDNNGDTTTMASYVLAVPSDSLDTNVTTLKTTSLGASQHDFTMLIDPDDLVDTEVMLSDPMIKTNLFFPPKTEISKVIFNITINGKASTYMWHPHMKTMLANTNYLLNLELDPDRKN